MTIQTNLSVSPYFDQHDVDSDYYRILFKPSTAVQTRELNELQTILQSQIEKFGDVILKTGTLLDGCQASFNTALPFVKIKDTTAAGAAVDLSTYIGLFARGDNANTKSRILDAVDGFEAQEPNLKTLYLRYLDSGVNSNQQSYDENETIEIYNPNNRLYNVNVVDGSSGFANTDRIVFLSAIEVQNTIGGTAFANGTFVEGEVITQSTTEAQAEIVNVINTGTSLILRIKPLSSALAIGNTANFSFSNSGATEFAIQGSNTENEAIITKIIGSGATAQLQTTPGGTIRNNIRILRGGSGYTTLPFVSVARQDSIQNIEANEQIIDALDLRAENFIARVRIATTADEGITDPTTGFGYSMSVTEGKIYQNGHFLRVAPQSIIVSKYTNTPDQIAVGFVTQEAIANAAIDPTLNDNARGSFNENAPGADRLELVPRLAVRQFNQLSGNSQFFPIYKFSEGNLYSQITDVQFNKIADELARRTYEESGNYVLNTFDITTRSTLDIEDSNQTFTYVIDPGLAYINGYRVETVRNFAKNVDKSIQATSVSTSLDVVYGNFIRCNEFAGFHAFTTGDLVELHSEAGKAITDSAGEVTDPDEKIGTARVRSIVHESGVQGTPGAVYRIHLFKIKMESGKNFRDVRSVFSADGIADVITEIDPSTSRDIAVLRRGNRNSLLFSTERPVKDISNLNYEFRTKKTAVPISETGVIELENTAGAQWPYSGELTTIEQNQLIILPENDLVSTVNATGTIDSANNTTLTGSGTLFGSQILVGDYIRVGANTVFITSIANTTSAQYGPEGDLDGLNSPATFKKVYPKNVPIPVAARENITAEIQGVNLVVDTDISLASADTVVVIFNQKVVNATAVNKPATRKAYVKIQANTHPNGVKGPWCLGVPDAFRLRNVYKGASTSGQQITQSFYIDSNQNENYLDLSLLELLPQTINPIGENDIILVEFDCFEANQEGVKTVKSYTIKDNLALFDLDTDNDKAVNTLEIPELVTRQGYYDLREVLDFRPAVKATATITQDPAEADTNPSLADPNDFFSGNNIKFPVPEGDAFFDMDFYVSRVDTILLNQDGEFEFMIGKEPKTINPNQFPLYRVVVPPYPSLPSNLSSSMKEIFDRKIANGSFSNFRRDKYTIISEELRKQVQGYTMEEISKLENRISVLEYFAQLSETEDQIKDLTIPSSIDSSIDRFKFGFFVDSFSDYSLSDLSSPEFNATVYGFILQPGTINYNMPLRIAGSSRTNLSGTKVAFPYEKVSFLSQQFATTGPREIVVEEPDPEDPTPPPPGPLEPPPFTRVCQVIRDTNENFTRVNSESQYDAVATSAQWPGVTESSTFTLAANTEADGQSIELSFNLGWGTDRIVIQQSRSPSAGFTTIFDTQANISQVQDLTQNERTQLRNQNISAWHPVISEWSSPDYDDFTATNQDDPVYQSSAFNRGFLKYIGKISIPYTSSAGRFIRVTIQKASPNFLYQLCYPADEIRDPIFGAGGSLFEIETESNLNFSISAETPKRECRLSTKELLLVQKGIITDRCAPPKDEEISWIDPTDPGEEEVDDEEENVTTPVVTIDEGESRDDEDDRDEEEQRIPEPIINQAIITPSAPVFTPPSFDFSSIFNLQLK